jgi:excinuclease ABC subunit B
MDDPTAKLLPFAGEGGRRRSGRGESKVHKPALDEMGIALHHEVAPHRPGGNRRGPRRPTLDEMGPGVEAIPGKRDASGPRSTLGRPGMHGGWKPRRR